MTRIIWLCGVAAPVGLSTIAGRLEDPWITWLTDFLPWWGWLVIAVFVAAIGLLAAISRRAYHLEKQLTPTISFVYQPQAPWITRITARTQAKDNPRRVVWTESLWFHAQIKNLTPGQVARHVQVKIADVECMDGEQYAPTPFASSQPLRWAQTGSNEFAPRDIAFGARELVDIASVDAEHNAVLIKWPEEWIANKDLFLRAGKYRLTLIAFAEKGPAAEARLILNWTGLWSETEMVLESVGGD